MRKLILIGLINLLSFTILPVQNSKQTELRQLRSQIQNENQHQSEISISVTDKAASQAKIQALKAQIKTLKQSTAKNLALLKNKEQKDLLDLNKSALNNPLANLQKSVEHMSTKVALIDSQMVNNITELAEQTAESPSSNQQKMAALNTAQKAEQVSQAATDTIMSLQAALDTSAKN